MLSVKSPTMRETLTFAPRFIESSFNPKTREVDVVILTEGLGNKRDKHYYFANTIKQAVQDRVFEGAQAYADHPSKFDDANRPERSVRDLIGYYYDSREAVVPDKKDPSKQNTAYIAKLKIQEGCDWALGLIREALDYQKRFPNNTYAGISINADGETEPATVNGEDVSGVMKITEAFSADVVTKPARQGGFLKLVEGHSGAHKIRIKESGMPVTPAEILAAAADLEKLAEGQEVDPKELKRISSIVREAFPPKKDGADDNDADDDKAKESEDDKKKREAKEAEDAKAKEAEDDKKKKESEAVTKTSFRESVTSVEDLKKNMPSLYEAALKEAEAVSNQRHEADRRELDTLRAEKMLRESGESARKLLKESKIPDEACEYFYGQLIGLTEAEMRARIAAQEKFVEAYIPATQIQGHGDKLSLRESRSGTDYTSQLLEGVTTPEED